MSYEMMVAMNVTDPEGYAEYRRQMRPILGEYGGEFRYDFVVSEVLVSQGEEGLNRVFYLAFPSEQAKVDFFSDERYLDVKQRFLEPSVAERVQMMTYIS